MQTFLRTTRERFLSKSGKKIIVCIGNEAGDVDTIVSSVGAAWSYDTPETPAVPIMPFKRDGFRLRKDAIKLFEMAGIQTDATGIPVDLMFWDDINDMRFSSGETDIILTDHNEIGPKVSEKFGNPNVVAIFDHHKDGGLHLDANPRIVLDGVGSASSIMTQHIFSNSSIEVPQELMRLFIGAILLDTRNFNKDAKKYNDLDIQSFDTLNSQYKVKFDPASDFNTLIEARFDVSGLNAMDLLGLDYKEAQVNGLAFGFSTIFDDMPGLVERAGGEANLIQDMVKFLNENQLTILVALCKVDKTTNTRGVVMYTTPEQKDLEEKVLEQIRNAPASLEKSLIEATLFIRQGISSTGFQFTSDDRFQKNLNAYHITGDISRKTLMPSILSFVESSL